MNSWFGAASGRPRGVTKHKASIELALSSQGLQMMRARFSVAAIIVTPVTAITAITAIPARVSLVPAVMAAVAVTVFIAMAVAGLVAALFHEVNGTIAGVVAMAILRPVLCVTRRHMQIHRLRHLVARSGGDYHRPGIDDCWRGGIAELYLAIDTRADFTAYTQVDDRRSGTGRQAGERQHGKYCN